MSVTFLKNKNKWKVDHRFSGTRKRMFFDSKREAIEFERKCRYDKVGLKENELNSTPLDVAFRHYYERETPKKSSRSQDSDKTYLNLAYHFLSKVCGRTFTDEVELDDLEQFKIWVAKEQTCGDDRKGPWAEATVSRCCLTIKRVFKYLAMIRKARGNPGMYWSIPVPECKQRRPMSRDEFAQIYAASPEWFKPTLKFMFLTGARASSVVRLTWNDVDLFKRVCILKSKKGMSARTRLIPIPLYDELFALLVEQRNKNQQAAQTDTVFRNDQGLPINHEHISKMGKKLIKQCGIKGVVLYGLRHALASEMTAAQIPTEMVRQALGHADIRTTQRYAAGFGLVPLSEAISKVRPTKVGTFGHEN